MWTVSNGPTSRFLRNAGPTARNSAFMSRSWLSKPCSPLLNWTGKYCRDGAERQDPDQEPDQEPVQDPDPENTLEPDQELDQEPDPEPALESDQEPDQETDPEPALESDQEPDQETDPEPALESDQEPDQEPDPEPALESDQELDQEPDQEPIQLNPLWNWIRSQFRIRIRSRIRVKLEVRGRTAPDPPAEGGIEQEEASPHCRLTVVQPEALMGDLILIAL
uniref:Uncharacterized protein n=1 Tax=Salarias fasciatus TaxID=181472 RepID=A0A672HZ00_SALFA